MVNEGFNDIVLSIEGENIPAISSVLCVSNQRLKSIIKDEKVDSHISLPDQVSKKSFSLLCKYYGYGIIELDEENVCDLMLCCICLNEEKLLCICEKYILCHQKERVVMNMLNLITYIPNNYLNDIKSTVSEYISLHCISILDNNEIFRSLYLDSLSFITSLENLLIPNEKYLLDKILKHYHENRERIEDKDEKYNEVMKNINWKEINLYDLEDKDLDIIDIKMIKKSKNEKPTKRKYGRIPKTENKRLNEMILNGFKDLESIKDIPCEDCEYLKSCESIADEISSYLKESQYLIEIITILRIMKKVNMKISELKMKDNERMKIIKYLDKKYEENVEEKLIVSECLSYFFENEEDGIFIHKVLSESIIIDMLKNKNIEDKSNIIDFVKNNLNDEEKQLIVSKIEDEEIKEKIIHTPQEEDDNSLPYPEDDNPLPFMNGLYEL